MLLKSQIIRADNILIAKDRIMYAFLPKFFNRHVLLFSAFLVATLGAEASPPPAPANLQGIFLPAEIMLSWNPSPGAAYYRVSRAQSNRRWVPFTDVALTRVRDGDFFEGISYYQVIAYNQAGEAGPPVECLVMSGAPAYIRVFGVNPRPVSDTSFAISWNLETYGDGLLEVGTSPTN